MSSQGATHPNQRHCPLFIEIPKQARPYYTSGDVIQGLVRVAPNARPLKIAIYLKGFSVHHDAEGNTIQVNFLHVPCELFVSSGAGESYDILRHGTAADGKVELPFQFTIPHTVTEQPPSDRDWWYPQDSYHHPRLQHSPGFALPPSRTKMSSTVGPLGVKISYLLEARMESTPAACTEIRVLHEFAFTPPAPECDLSLLHPNLNWGLTLPARYCRYKFIRTRKLLPGYHKSSKLGKIRDIMVEKEIFFGLESLTEIPFARFNVLATPARVLVIGAPIPVTISVQHLERSSSLADPPSLFLRRVRIQLLPSFTTYFPYAASDLRHGKEAPQTSHDTLILLDKRFTTGDGAPLVDGLKLQDLTETRMLHDRMLPSFTSYGMTLEYELRVDVWGECASHEWGGIVCKEAVQVVSSAGVGVGGGIVGEVGEAEMEPVYQELDPLAGMGGLESRLLRSGGGDDVSTSPLGSLGRMHGDSRALPPSYVA